MLAPGQPTCTRSAHRASNPDRRDACAPRRARIMHRQRPGRRMMSRAHRDGATKTWRETRDDTTCRSQPQRSSPQRPKRPDGHPVNPLFGRTCAHQVGRKCGCPCIYLQGGATAGRTRAEQGARQQGLLVRLVWLLGANRSPWDPTSLATRLLDSQATPPPSSAIACAPHAHTLASPPITLNSNLSLGFGSMLNTIRKVYPQPAALLGTTFRKCCWAYWGLALNVAPLNCVLNFPDLPPHEDESSPCMRPLTPRSG